MKRPRLKDVAALAGVSQGTASNVFNKPHLVTEEMKSAVLSAASQLGYTGPQAAARLLRSGKSGLVALLTDESTEYLVSDAYGRRLLAGVASACDQAGAGLTIIGGSAGDGASAWSVDTALADGAVIHCFEEGDEIFDRLWRRGLPYVTVDGGRRSGLARIGIDEEAAAEAPMSHLVGLGHRHVGILSLEVSRGFPAGPIDDPAALKGNYQTTVNRFHGLIGAARAGGLERSALPAFQTHSDEKSVAAGVDWLMDRADPPTAICAMSDVIAMMAIARLKARGLRVPEDLSVTGFDGIQEGAYADPPLTTVVQPAEEKGRAAVEILLGAREAADLILPTEFVVRQSTARRPGG